MFERICLPPKEPEGIQFDLGRLAELLVFYREVHLILGRTSLQGLLQQLGSDLLLFLISEQHLRVYYNDHIFSAITAGKGTPLELYDVGVIHLEGSNLETEARKAFIETTGKSGRGRRLAQKFCRLVKPISYAEGITQTITQDMQSGLYIEAFVKKQLQNMSTQHNLGGLNQLRYRFSLQPGRGFRLLTNLDLGAIQAAGIDASGVDDPASVLATYGTTVAEMSMWAQLNCEAAVTPRQANVLTARVETILSRHMDTASRISAFQDFVFDDAHAIRESINQGRHEFRDLVPVLSQARKFNHWLSSQPTDISLLKAYHKEVTAGTWIDKLPGKIARWSVFTGAGIGLDVMGGGGLGTTTGVALSLLDSFFLDKLIKGWKPHHFVEGPLKEFVKNPAP